MCIRDSPDVAPVLHSLTSSRAVIRCHVYRQGRKFLAIITGRLLVDVPKVPSRDAEGVEQVGEWGGGVPSSADYGIWGAS